MNAGRWFFLSFQRDGQHVLLLDWSTLTPSPPREPMLLPLRDHNDAAAGSGGDYYSRSVRKNRPRAQIGLHVDARGVFLTGHGTGHPHGHGEEIKRRMDSWSWP